MKYLEIWQCKCGAIAYRDSFGMSKEESCTLAQEHEQRIGEIENLFNKKFMWQNHEDCYICGTLMCSSCGCCNCDHS